MSEIKSLDVIKYSNSSGEGIPSLELERLLELERYEIKRVISKFSREFLKNFIQQLNRYSMCKYIIGRDGMLRKFMSTKEHWMYVCAMQRNGNNLNYVMDCVKFPSICAAAGNNTFKIIKSIPKKIRQIIRSHPSHRITGQTFEILLSPINLKRMANNEVPIDSNKNKAIPIAGLTDFQIDHIKANYIIEFPSQYNKILAPDGLVPFGVAKHIMHLSNKLDLCERFPISWDRYTTVECRKLLRMIMRKKNIYSIFGIPSRYVTQELFDRFMIENKHDHEPMIFCGIVSRCNSKLYHHENMVHFVCQIFNSILENKNITDEHFNKILDEVQEIIPGKMITEKFIVECAVRTENYECTDFLIGISLLSKRKIKNIVKKLLIHSRRIVKGDNSLCIVSSYQITSDMIKELKFQCDDGSIYDLGYEITQELEFLQRKKLTLKEALHKISEDYTIDSTTIDYNSEPLTIDTIMGIMNGCLDGIVKTPRHFIKKTSKWIEQYNPNDMWEIPVNVSLDERIDYWRQAYKLDQPYVVLVIPPICMTRSILKAHMKAYINKRNKLALEAKNENEITNDTDYVLQVTPIKYNEY